MYNIVKEALILAISKLYNDMVQMYMTVSYYVRDKEYYDDGSSQTAQHCFKLVSSHQYMYILHVRYGAHYTSTTLANVLRADE